MNAKGKKFDKEKLKADLLEYMQSFTGKSSMSDPVVTNHDYKDTINTLVDELYERTIGGKITVYRGVQVKKGQAKQTAKYLAKSGKVGNYWSYKESGAMSQNPKPGEMLQDPRVRLEAQMDVQDIDLPASVIQNLSYPDEAEFVSKTGKAKLTNVAYSERFWSDLDQKEKMDIIKSQPEGEFGWRPTYTNIGGGGRDVEFRPGGDTAIAEYSEKQRKRLKQEESGKLKPIDLPKEFYTPEPMPKLPKTMEPLGSKSTKSTDPTRQEIAKGSDTQKLLQLTPSQGTSGEVEGNQWLPVNSQSGNVEGVYLDEGEAGVAPTIYVSFSGGNIYSYQQDDRMKKDPHQIVSDIMQQGGEAVWEDLRASQAKRSGHKPGEDMGSPKTGGSKRFAFVGSAHMTDYKKERVGPVGQGLIKSIKQTDILSSALRQRTTQLREKMKTTKGLGSKVSKGVGALMGMYSKAWKNDYPTTHPLIQRYNSISNAARELHKSKNTLYKLMDVSNEVLRVNSMHWGNSFSTSNPFIYANSDFPSGYAVEYQCPQSIQKLIGVSVPIWIQHKNSQRTEEEFVGTYNITGWDEQNGHEIATYDIDWDLVDEIFERERVENWIKPLRQQGKYPDTSTEYDCKLRYDRERAKFIQTDFNLIGLALVPQGNCSGTACAIKDT